MLFWVTRLFRDTRKAKLVPEKNVTHHHARVAASENEELRPHAEGGEGDFWEHRVFATRGVAVEEVGFVRKNLNEAFVWVFEEEVVSELKGVERDTVLGEEGEVVVEGVVEEVSPELILRLRESNSSSYVYLFARKFAPECLTPLMEIADDVILRE